MNWTDIKTYENTYQISDTGLVKSKTRFIILNNGKSKFIKGKLLKQKKHNEGYMFVSLSKNGISKNHYIHRLLADTFIPNPENKPQVNHKNGNKSDNTLLNLEWATISENTQHAYKTGLSKNIGGMHRNARKLIDSCSGTIYESLREASEKLELNYHSVRNMLCGSNKNTTCLEYMN